MHYAGSIVRPGSNSEYQRVDERITGRKPRNLSFEEAAATWFAAGAPSMVERLEAPRRAKPDAKPALATDAYLEFFAPGGTPEG